MMIFLSFLLFSGFFWYFSIKNGGSFLNPREKYLSKLFDLSMDTDTYFHDYNNTLVILPFLTSLLYSIPSVYYSFSPIIHGSHDFRYYFLSRLLFVIILSLLHSNSLKYTLLLLRFVFFLPSN